MSPVCLPTALHSNAISQRPIKAVSSASPFFSNSDRRGRQTDGLIRNPEENKQGEPPHPRVGSRKEMNRELIRGFVRSFLRSLLGLLARSLAPPITRASDTRAANDGRTKNGQSVTEKLTRDREKRSGKESERTSSSALSVRPSVRPSVRLGVCPQTFGERGWRRERGGGGSKKGVRGEGVSLSTDVIR